MAGQIGVGMVGYAFMGAAHSQAWRTVHHAFDLPLTPRMAVLCGRDAEAASAAAAKLGWAAVETDWKRLVESDDVGLVDICTPGDTHAEIALAALAAGKHVLCEKPLANTVAEAEAMADAATAAAARGVRSMVAFNYRRVPALAFARSLVADGRLGEIRHVRVRRFTRKLAGTYLTDVRGVTDPDLRAARQNRREAAQETYEPHEVFPIPAIRAPVTRAAGR